MDAAFAVGRMLSNKLLYDRSDKFFTLRFRDPLCVGNPRSANPRSQVVAVLVDHVFCNELGSDRCKSELGQPIPVSIRRAEAVGELEVVEERTPFLLLDHEFHYFDNVLRVPLPAHLEKDMPRRLKALPYLLKHGEVVCNPVETGVGENKVEFAVEVNLPCILQSKGQIGMR